MHEILFLALTSSAPAATTVPTGSSDSVKIAIITAISVVLAAAITAVSATFTKRHSNDTHSEQFYVDELVRRAEIAETRAGRLEELRDGLLKQIDVLEGYCWRAGVDPNTGESVVVGPPKGATS